MKWIAWLLPFPLLAQPPTNVAQLYRLADSLAAELLRALPQSQSLQLRVVPHPAAWLLEHALARQAERFGVAIVPADSAQASLELAIVEVGIRYDPLPDGLLRRSAQLSVSALLRSSPAAMYPLPLYRMALVDTLPRRTLPAVEQPEYPFATAPVAEERSLWRELLEPAIATIAGGLLLVLLFTLRSP
jgi:hypothetical protein